MSLVKKLKSAGFWQLLQTVVQVSIQFGYMAVMARLLSKADFGLMALASAFIGFGVLFSEAGMGAALVQRKEITQKHMNAALQGSVITGLFIFIIFYISAESIAVFFEQPLLESIIKIIGIIVILSSLGNVSRSLLQKHFRFKNTSIVIMCSTAIAYCMGVIFAYLNYGVWSLVIANTVNVLLTTVIMLYLAPVKISFHLYFKEWKDLFSFGSGMVLSRLINQGSSKGLILVLGKIFQPIELGVFERAFAIKTLPSSYLGGVLDTIMFPVMSEIQDEQEKLFRIYQHSLGVVNTVLIPAALFFIFFTKEIILILLGKDWLDAVFPLQIMFLILPFSSSVKMADSVIRAKGLIYKNVVRRSIHLFILIITATFGAQYYGVVGAAIAVTFSYLLNYCIMLFLVRTIFNKSFIEIFFLPVTSGVKLSLLVLILLIIPTIILDNWNHDSIVKFFISTLFLSGLMFLIAMKKPELLGVYLQETLVKIFPKRKI